MSEKKAYPLRIAPPVLDAMHRWANDDQRTLHAQIEHVLREDLREAGRLQPAAKPRAIPDDAS
ncbi:MAG: Arc family DNA binding domain-containing protein [Dokdonella sp.]|uniref:Arc family DNA binding domain-containing protein n=1 Tax=Dokdonella sp. TaxID=2291710 RepID=UPI003F823D06